MVWNIDNVCMWTRSTLKEIVHRYPVFGDFEKQLWLDQYCQNPEVNPDVTQCDISYFAYFSLEDQKLVCTTNQTSPCPVKTDLHDNLENLIKG